MKQKKREQLQQQIQVKNSTRKIEILRNVIVSSNIEEIATLTIEYLGFYKKGSFVTKEEENRTKLIFKNYITKLTSIEIDFSIYNSHIANLQKIVELLPSRLDSNDQLISPEYATNLLQKYDYHLFFNQRLNSTEVNQLKSLYAKIYNNYYYHLTLSTNLIDSSYANKSFILLHSIYKSDPMNIKTERDIYKFQNFILHSIFKYGSEIAEIQKIMDIFKTDLETMSEEWKEERYKNTYTIRTTNVVIREIKNMWSHNSTKAEQLLKFFVNNKLPLEGELRHNNALTIAMEGNINLELIEILLRDYKINPNRIMYDAIETEEQKFSTMPFSVAIGTTNFELIKLLLEYGADPYLPSNELYKSYQNKSNEFIEFTSSNSRLLYMIEGSNNERISANDIDRYIITCGLESHITDIEKKREYFKHLDEFIENFFINKFIYTASQELIHHSEEEEKIEFKLYDSKEAQEDVIEGKAHDKVNLEEKIEIIPLNLKSASEDTLKISNTIVTQYLNYKENTQNYNNISENEKLKHQFDFLLLDFIRTNNAQIMLSLRNMLDEFPELHSYSITSILNNYSEDMAHNIFASKPKMLNKFFELKKKNMDKNDDINHEKLKDSNPGIYEVSSTIDNKISIKFKITDNIYNALNIEEKQLKDLKVIKKDALKEKGIKFYRQAIKLKLNDNDNAAYATKLYKDEEGNILIIFDQMHNHKWLNRQVKKIEIELLKTNTPYKIYDNTQFQTSYSHEIEGDTINTEEKNEEMTIVGDIDCLDLG